MCRWCCYRLLGVKINALCGGQGVCVCVCLFVCVSARAGVGVGAGRRCGRGVGVGVGVVWAWAWAWARARARARGGGGGGVCVSVCVCVCVFLCPIAWFVTVSWSQAAAYVESFKKHIRVASGLYLGGVYIICCFRVSISCDQYRVACLPLFAFRGSRMRNGLRKLPRRPKRPQKRRRSRQMWQVWPCSETGVFLL